MAFSPDGRRILIGPGRGRSATPAYNLRLIDVETGTDITAPNAFMGHTEAVQDIVFNPDGKSVLSAGYDHALILWDAVSGEELQRFEGHTGAANKVAFSPGCNPQTSQDMPCVAASAGADNMIIVWDIESGAPLRRYQGHYGGILGLVFTPDGKNILSTAVDDTVREWRLDLDQTGLMDWIAANRYTPELSCWQRAQYHIEPLCN